MATFADRAREVMEAKGLRPNELASGFRSAAPPLSASLPIAQANPMPMRAVNAVNAVNAATGGHSDK